MATYAISADVEIDGAKYNRTIRRNLTKEQAIAEVEKLSQETHLSHVDYWPEAFG